MILIISPIMTSLVPRPSEGEEGKAWYLLHTHAQEFSVKMSVKVGGHVHGKVLWNEYVESHALHQCHITFGK